MKPNHAVLLVKDGSGGAGREHLVWNVYAVDDDGKRTLLSPTHVLEVKEPQVVEVMRPNKDTKKLQKEKRHIDVVIGTRTVTGESQAMALARAIKELEKSVVQQNNVRGVLLPVAS